MKSFSRCRLQMNFRQLINSKSFYTNSIRRFGEMKNEAKMITLAENEDLNTILKESKVPVMLDFYADWCPPCKKLTPILIKKFEDEKNFTLVKVNVDDHPVLCEKYKVEGIPQINLIHNEKEIAKFVGIDMNELDGMIESIKKM